MELNRRIEAALGERPVHTLLKNARLVNVMSGEIHSASIAIHEEMVVGFGEYDAENTIDLEGRYVTPGLIDGHLHLESSMLSIPEFARNVLPYGTTAVVADPHEIANVLGVAGIRYILESSNDLPLHVFVMVPSCVPATPFETSGATLLHQDLVELRDEDRVLGLAEMMNFPGVLFRDPEVLAKLAAFSGRPIDGHAPGLTGKSLAAYVAAGVRSDHECTQLEEAREKLRLGMRIMIREGSAAKNLLALLPLVTESNSRNCFFVTDDLDPRDILEQGHLNGVLRRAVEQGTDPVRVVQMATVNTARYFGFKRRGAVAPGYIADLLVFEDLVQFKPLQVFARGKLVAENGRLVVDVPDAPQAGVRGAVRIDWSTIPDLGIKAEGDRVNVIQVIPGEIVTKRVVEAAPLSDGRVVAAPERDLLKIAVLERHHGTGAHAAGLIKGFGLREGAIAGSVAHDSHNVIVVGANDADMIIAAKTIESMGGGMVAVSGGEVRARLPLPIAGLMSDRPISEVAAALDEINQAARRMGCTLDAPFDTLSFMALTPIPELKITDQGLFDSVNFQFTSLFASAAPG